MSKRPPIIGIMFAVAAIIALSAGSSHAQGKGNGNGNGNGNGREKRTSIASIFKWPGSSEKKAKGKENLNRYKGLSKKTGHSPESLWAWYESERSRNPRLTHGQFVAANMIARNPRRDISAQTILDGLRRGDSIGQVLHRKGMSDREIRDERDRLRRVISDDRGVDYGYDDLDSYWKVRR